MNRSARLALGAVGGLVGAAGLWSLYQRHATETVPYEVAGRVGDDVELRRYPATVAVETTAGTESEAFRRLFRYISGANEADEDLAMTAPVEVDPPNGSGDGDGVAIPMTAPVEIGEEDGPVSQPDIMGGADGSGAETAAADAEADRDPSGAGGERMELHGSEIRMAFYLPAEYDAESAPRPTDGRVELVAVPGRTLAVRRFAGRPTDRRVRRRTALLLEALDTASLTPVGEPFYMGYDAPWTLPFLRRNEVAVEIERGDGTE